MCVCVCVVSVYVCIKYVYMRVFLLLLVLCVRCDKCYVNICHVAGQLEVFDTGNVHHAPHMDLTPNHSRETVFLAIRLKGKFLSVTV